MEGSVAVDSLLVLVGSALEEQSNSLLLVAQHCNEEGTLSDRVGRIDVGAVVQQDVHHFEETVERRPAERGRVRTCGQVHGRTVLEQQLHQINVSPSGGNPQRRGSVYVFAGRLGHDSPLLVNVGGASKHVIRQKVLHSRSTSALCQEDEGSRHAQPVVANEGLRPDPSSRILVYQLLNAGNEFLILFLRRLLAQLAQVQIVFVRKLQNLLIFS